MDLSQAEKELLELVRVMDATNFTLTITVDGGQWTISTTVLDANTSGVGQGSSFNEGTVSLMRTSLQSLQGKVVRPPADATRPER